MSTVNYVLSDGRSKGQIRTATVVRDWGGEAKRLNLQVHTDHTNDFAPGQNGSQGLLWATSVPYSEEKEPGTWHLQDQAQPVAASAPRPDIHAQVENSFTYHPPKEGQQPKYEEIRNRAKAFALALVELTPGCREQSLALTDLENCVAHANAAIARHT